MDSKSRLDVLVERYNDTKFIAPDPISIPHRFAGQADREIAGLFAAMFAWGQRPTIINKSSELLQRMDNQPHAFVRSASNAELQTLRGFVHRTFNETDLLYFVDFLTCFYRQHSSLEVAFLTPEGRFFSIRHSLEQFHKLVFAADYAPARSRKHLPNPASGSACKRLNMYLRWMVRSDEKGVDFGLWKRIPMAALMIPLDLHVHRVATAWGLLSRRQADWQAVEELTARLRTFDPHDPAKYDFALFGSGVNFKITDIAAFV